MDVLCSDKTGTLTTAVMSVYADRIFVNPGTLILVVLLSHCCYTAVTLLLHCCYTVVTLQSHCCYTAIALLLHCCSTLSLQLHGG
jgi:magnesium-transporting ATPase (P-type)